jgi:parallel beta-helix repeat protein
MKSKTVYILILLLLCSSLTFLFPRMVDAHLPFEYDFAILPNGEISKPEEIDLPTTCITTLDNVTYALTCNISLVAGIIVFRSNITFDGGNYTIEAGGRWSFGFKLDGVHGVTVRNLNFLRSRGEIWLTNTSDCVLVDNDFANCGRGFWIVDSTNVTLVQNTMQNTRFGDIIGDSLDHYMHSIDTSNTVNEKPVYYLTNQRNLTIDPSSYPEIGSLALVNSSDVTVRALTLVNIYALLLIAFTNNSKIIENAIKNCDYGIRAVSSCNNTISKNELVNVQYPLELDCFSCNSTITENRVESGVSGITLGSSYNIVSYNNLSGGLSSGIDLYSGSNSVVYGNTISSSGIGIGLGDSWNNTFIRNSITNATFAALHLSNVTNNTFYQNRFEGRNSLYIHEGINGTNIWDNGVEGNYWNDYNGTDSNQDGLGDTPYVIDENNRDHYPLMGTFQSFNVSAWDPERDVFVSKEVDVISNSTIGQAELVSNGLTGAQYSWRLHFTVLCENGTIGFYRITLPNDLLYSSNYTIFTDYVDKTHEYIVHYVNFFNGRIVQSNSTCTTLYFSYNQTVSSYTMDVVPGLVFPEFPIPEFPTFLTLPLFMIAMLLVIVTYKRRILKRVL